MLINTSKLKIIDIVKRAFISLVCIVILSNDLSQVAMAGPFNGATETERIRASYGALYSVFGEECSTTSTSPALGTIDINNLTEDQKIAQTFLVGFTKDEIGVMQQVVKKYKIGGIYVLENNQNDQHFKKEIFDSLNNETGVPLIVASDEEGGTVQRFRNLVGEMPSALEMGTSKTKEEVEQIAKDMGTKIKSAGVNTILAPTLDIDYPNVGSEAVHELDRTFGSDPAVITEKAGAFAAGLRSVGINPTYKHFPGLGSSPGDSDFTDTTTFDINTLKAKDVKPFQDLVNQYDGMVMLNGAHVPGLTADGEIASTSPAAVNMLRNDLKFNGIIMTDALEATGVPDHQNVEIPITKALQAGVDMPIFAGTGDADAIIQRAIDKVKQSGVKVDDRVKKILTYKQKNLSGSNTSNTLTPTPSGSQVSSLETLENHKVPARSGGLGLEEEAKKSGGKIVLARNGDSLTFSPKGAVDQDIRFYIAMRWRYVKWAWSGSSSTSGFPDKESNSWFSQAVRKVIVTNKKTGRSIVVAAIEVGPAPWTGTAEGSGNSPSYWGGYIDGTPSEYKGRVAGLSPAAFEAIGAKQRMHGEPVDGDEFEYGWSSDQNLPSGTILENGQVIGSGGSGNDCSGNINSDSATLGNFVVYNQYDPRWADKPYGSSTISRSGCFPAAMAMVLNAFGKKNPDGSQITPVDTANFSTNRGFYDGSGGTSWAMPMATANNWGLNGEDLGVPDINTVKDKLNNGYLIAATGRGPKPFTSGGHIMVMRGVSANGNLLIGDPGHSDTSDKEWPPEDILSSVRNAWAFK